MSGNEDSADDSGVDIPEAPSTGGPDPDDLGPDIPTAPGSEFDPDQLGPDIPTPPEPGEGDTGVVALFWKLVVVFNVAVFGLAVGPMIGVFLGDWDLGLQVFAVGALAFAYGTIRYDRFRRGRDEEPDEPETA